MTGGQFTVAGRSAGATVKAVPDARATTGRRSVRVWIPDVTAGVPHVFQSFTGSLDEADAALDRAGRFILDRLATAPAAL